MTIIHGRHVGPLIGVWVAIFGTAAVLYWIQFKVPALIDIMTPVYILLGVLLIIGTVRWFRERSRSNRRRTDRRHLDRRDGPHD